MTRQTLSEPGERREGSVTLVFWNACWGVATFAIGIVILAEPTRVLPWLYLLVALTFGICGLVLISRRRRIVKRVEADSEFLYVSLSDHVVTVPLSSIAAVTQDLMWSLYQPVTVWFRSDSEQLGNKIAFVPTFRREIPDGSGLLRYDRLRIPHPVVRQLLDGVHQARKNERLCANDTARPI